MMNLYSVIQPNSIFTMQIWPNNIVQTGNHIVLLNGWKKFHLFRGMKGKERSNHLICDLWKRSGSTPGSLEWSRLED